MRKGLYLYGDFGVGKSFMVAALAHDLSEKRGVSSTLLHYPSFVIDAKNAISDGNVKTLVDEIKLSVIDGSLLLNESPQPNNGCVP